MESVEISVKDETAEEDYFGPALPPHLLKRKDSVEDGGEQKIIGPVLPEGFGRKKEEPDSSDKNIIGPEIPEGFNIPQQEEEGDDSDEDEDVGFGPSTALMTTEDVDPTYKFRSAQTSKKDREEETNVTKRESWMTELPDKKTASFGLFPRHFKTRVQTDKESDSSVWTDTPADKKKKKEEEGQGKKKDHREELKAKMLEERNKEMEKLARKAAKKLRKKESLLEMHLKNMKKKKKKEAKKREKEGKVVPERRPFDRNVDLQIRKFDEGQKRAILSKSQFLNDRFASGQSKFL